MAKDNSKRGGKDDQEPWTWSKTQDGKEPAESRWDLDSYKAADQRKGIYDWSRKTY